MSVRRRARKAASNPESSAAIVPSGLPTEFQNPDDPRWCDDHGDLAPFREWYSSLPVDIEVAVCRLGRWKRLIAAADRFAVERGWVLATRNSEVPLVDRGRLVAEGVPLMQWRKERLRLVGSSMWSATTASVHKSNSEVAPF